MPNIGPLELIVVLVIVLLIFGPKRLPSLGRQLGGGMREFKDSITGKDEDEKTDATGRPALSKSQADEPVEQQAAPTAPATPAAPTTPAAPADAAPEQRG
ncbi:twin-arginine translocase TatA/TatE family subunit [Conexibacter sp. JD483]|uniref:twin-arginine translocase TatA/TatE family subunit n=1 Tax=unclassified Conexibacter TaxID=2627773 RepID=UPI0027246131|nr:MULTISPECIES: twin-arginine translocase TatA/TatE family subunit [unclassified Conexibacter]MDO8184417.1 twin-arginine translocase TatA/TatE family subunit [Conexibacter sp. CPCC 205706]MDO8197723.1 twin-arginine translocase TatA/TatE family subunit [Conexibacter sp. CPCC 205762]MDR9368141.1 twin-arginine translocase TatA/TatE family subunit [Conexibacter sp. JD483]